MAIVGIPDEKWGERVTAVIVVKEGHQLTAEEVKAHCLKRLGRFKLPRLIFFVGKLPKTDVGKIDKKQINEDIAASRL